MSAPASIQVAAAENALSGEKSFGTVHYPSTGDAETDLILVVMTYLNQNSYKFLPGRVEACLEYVLERQKCVTAHCRPMDRVMMDNPLTAAPPGLQQYTSGGTSAIGQGILGPVTTAGHLPGQLKDKDSKPMQLDAKDHLDRINDALWHEVSNQKKLEILREAALANTPNISP